MQIAREILLFFILIFQFLFVSGQCPAKDSVLNATAKVDQPGIDLKKLLDKMIGYVDEFSKCTSRDDSLKAKLLRSTGVVYYKLGDLDRAIQLTNQSIKAARSIKDKTSLQDNLLLENYINLYYYYSSLSQIHPKVEAIDSCMAIERRLNSNYINTCYLIGEKVQYLLYKGDYVECIRYAEMGQKYNAKYASSIKVQAPDYDSIGYDFFNFTYRIDALIFLGDFLQAERLVKEKLEFFRKVNYTYNLGVLYNLFGHVYNLKGDYHSAQKYFMLSYRVNERLRYPKGSVQSLGKVALIFNQHFKIPDSALWYCKKALPYCDKVDSIYILNLMANAFIQKGIFEEAFLYFKRSYEKLGLGSEISVNLIDKLDDESSQKIIEYITGLLMDYGQGKLQEYKTRQNLKSLEEATNIFTITDHVLSKIKTDYSEPETKLFWRSHSRRLYEFAIEACYLSGQKQKAFYFLEKSRAVLLNEQLNDQHWLNRDQIDQQKALKDQIGYQEKQLRKIDIYSSEYLRIQGEIVSKREKLKQLTQGLRESNPLYFQSYLDTAMIRIPDVQMKILTGRGSFVELFVGDSAVYLMIITEKDIYFRQLNKGKYVALLQQLKNGIAVPSNSIADINNTIQKSRELYAFLFQGINLQAGKLIVSPDAQIFPFEILITNQAGSPKYFVEDYAVSYTYSARYLLNSFSNNSRPRGNLLGFAPIRFTRANASLAELRGSDQSLEKLMAYFHHADEYTGDKATKSNFLSRFSDYGIIQLYTHASAGGESKEPVIYFSDSILSLSELIPESKPLTQLIILSACETGKGKFYEGEGTFSFNRAFAAVGIPAAVTTLWSVESESTYQVTELFYKYLSEGNPTDIALQKAKLEFLRTASKEKSLPYFWAGPILSGKTEKIEFAKSNPWKWVGLGLGLALLITLFYWLRRRAK